VITKNFNKVGAFSERAEMHLKKGFICMMFDPFLYLFPHDHDFDEAVDVEYNRLMKESKYGTEKVGFIESKLYFKAKGSVKVISEQELKQAYRGGETWLRKLDLIKEINLSEHDKLLLKHDLDHYVCTLLDGSYIVKHARNLISILYKGHDCSEYGYLRIEPCLNGNINQFLERNKVA
jgi:hypothetical protein